MDENTKSTTLSWTASQLVERYIEENILRPDTIRSYRLAAHICEKDMGLRNLSEIDCDIVLKWRRILLNRVRPTIWNTYRLHLGVIWNYAERNFLVDSNPFMEIRPAPVLKKSKKTVSDDLLAETISVLRDPENAERAPKPA